MIIKNTEPLETLHIFLDSTRADALIEIHHKEKYGASKYFELSLEEAEKVLKAFTECVIELRKRQEEL